MHDNGDVTKRTSYVRGGSREGKGGGVLHDDNDNDHT